MDEDLPLPSRPAASQPLTPCTGIMQGSSAPSAAARGVGTAQVAQAVADSDIDRLLFTARVQGLPDSLPRLPWESGVMAAIFGDSFLPKPLVVQPGAPAESTTSVDDGPNLSDVSRVRPAPCTLYEQSFTSRADVPVQEEDAHLWARAVGKWCTIFLLAHSDPGQVGVQAAQCLAAEGEAARDELLRDVFGLKSPRTAIKRANALLRCLRWHQREHDFVWPWDSTSVTAFVKSLGDSVCAVSGFFEAINFAHHVMGLPFHADILADRRLQGRAKRLAGERPEATQQTPLTVEAVAKLEKLVAGRLLCTVDTYVLGGLLFALFSRSRWSDLKQIRSIWIDFDDDDCVSGFVEARTREHKTSNTVRTKRRAMPLVAPFPGVTEAGWVAAWFDAGRQLGVVWDDEPFGPLVRAPNSSGHLCARRCSSSEAGAMLCSALNLEGHERRTSHVLKGTTLAWVGKRGFSERDGLLLGHHAPGSSSLACYSRELLSAPLRAYRAMLREIRSNTFKPDTTRSGWLAGCDNLGLPKSGGFASADVGSAEALRAAVGLSAAGGAGLLDPGAQDELEHYRAHNVSEPAVSSGHLGEMGSWDEVGFCGDGPSMDESEPPTPRPDAGAAVDVAVDKPDSPSSDSSSSSSSSSSSGASETEEQTLAHCRIDQPFEIDEPCWQHVKSMMLHRVHGDRNAFRTRCGRRTSAVYRWLDGAYFKWPRCAVCWKGELLSSKGAMAERLDVLMKRS